MTNLFQKNKNIHQHLSDRKIRDNLPRIHLKLPFKNSLITLNYNENSNCIPFVLPRLNYSTKKIKCIKFKTWIFSVLFRYVYIIRVIYI